jgi:hypothetical protein
MPPEEDNRKPYSGKPTIRFDEGELEIEPLATTPALYSTESFACGFSLDVCQAKLFPMNVESIVGLTLQSPFQSVFSCVAPPSFFHLPIK